MPTLSAPQGHGWLLTIRPHRANGLFAWSGSATGGEPFLALRFARARTELPATASRAGVSVRAATIVTATTTAAASPSFPTNGTPDTYSPRIAITTVVPATRI